MTIRTALEATAELLGFVLFSAGLAAFVLIIG